MPRQKVYASDADRIYAFRERKRAAEQEADRLRREAEYAASKRDQRIQREVNLWIADVLSAASQGMQIGSDPETMSDEPARLACLERIIQRTKRGYC